MYLYIIWMDNGFIYIAKKIDQILVFFILSIFSLTKFAKHM